MTPERLTAIEDRLVSEWNAGSINSLTHFSGSTNGELEQWLCGFFTHEVCYDDWVLCSHRAHFEYTLYCYKQASKEVLNEEQAAHIAEEALVEQVLAGRSMFMHSRRFIQSAIVGGLCATAAGIGLSIQQRQGSEHVYNFVGDGATCEGAFWEAAMFVEEHRLPVTFIVESNSRQCGVPMDNQVRRGLCSTLGCVRWLEYPPKYAHAGTDMRPKLKSQEKPAWLK